MAGLRFDWGPRKDRVNQQKHGISFAEASTVFLDEEALLLADPDHSTEEERFILLGFSASLRMLVVVHVYRKQVETIRIISARKATRSERAQYAGRWKR